MVLRCILIPTAAGIDVSRRLEASLKLGKRFGAHVRVLFVSPDPNKFLATLPEVALAVGVTVQSLEKEVRDYAALGKSAFDDWCRQENVTRGDPGARLDSVFATWDEEIGELETILALAGRITDITIVDRPTDGGRFAERALDTAVFSTGRAVLAVPKHLPDDLLRHVVIAWNGNLEAAHAIGQSIDVLHGAERVSIIQVDHDPQAYIADLGAYLRWHGIVTHPMPIKESNHVGAAIIAQTMRSEATMLVMGAYTHSRFRQFLLGGVTKHVLDHATIPVLIAH